MRTHLAALLCFGALACAGGVPEEISAVLKEKDLAKFIDYYMHPAPGQTKVQAYNEFQRDLVADYQEGLYTLERSVRDFSGSATSTVYTYRVTLLCKGNLIFKYDVSEKKNKKVNGAWEPYYSVLDAYADNDMFAKMDSSFKSTFGQNINVAELFSEDVVYGDHCGFVGVDPEGRTESNQLLAAMDREELKKWLGSTVAEKQVYAVDAYHQLKKKGVALTLEEKKMIEAIKKKKGTIRVCSGCIYSSDDISRVTSRFKF